MKKLFSIALLGFFVLLSWVLLDFYSQKQYIQTIENGSTPVIFNFTTNITRNDFVEIVNNAKKNRDVVITTREYPDNTARTAKEIFNIVVFSTSPEKTSASVAGLFNPTYTINVQELTPEVNIFEGREFCIFAATSESIATLQDYFMENGIEMVYIEDGSLPSMILAEDVIFRFQLLVFYMVFLLVLSCYSLISFNKGIAVYKMLGYGIFRCSIVTMKRQFMGGLLFCLFAITAGNIVFFVFLNEYRGTVSYFVFWAKAILILLLILSLVIFIFSLITYRIIQIQAGIKNKKPYLLLNGVVLISKILAGILIIIQIGVFIVHDTKLNLLTADISHWSQVGEYYSVPIYMNSGEPDYVNGLKYKELYSYLDDEGAILMQPDYNVIASNNGDTTHNNEDKYFWRNHRVFINDNYLQFNPIIGIDGQQIELTQQKDELAVTILVPEQYRDYKSVILDDFVETATFHYYQDERYYYEHVLNKVFPESKMQPIAVNIVYVKNNQKYRLLNIKYGAMAGSYVIDPIGVVINKVNIGGDIYLSALSSSDLLVKADTDEPYNQYRKAIINAGLQNNIPRLQKVGDTIDEFLSNVKGVRDRVLIHTLALSSLLLLLIFISSQLIIQTKAQSVAIKQMLGNNPVVSAWQCYLYSILSILCFSLIALTLRRSFTVISIFAVIWLIIEVTTISLFVLKVQMVKIIKEVK